MSRDFNSTTARRAVALACLCSISALTGCVFTLRWVFVSTQPRLVDTAFAAVLSALLGYLGLWSASAVRPCLTSTRRAGNHHLAAGKHAASTPSRPRAAAFFLSLSAVAGGAAVNPLAHASPFASQVSTEAELASSSSNDATATRPEPAFVPLEPPPPLSSSTPSPTWRPVEKSPKQTQPPHAGFSASSRHTRGNPVPSFTHRVVAGETVWQITKRQLVNARKQTDIATAVQQVLSANPQVKGRPNKIQAGERLQIPEVDATPGPQKRFDTDLPPGETQ